MALEKGVPRTLVLSLPHAARHYATLTCAKVIFSATSLFKQCGTAPAKNVLPWRKEAIYLANMVNEHVASI